MLKQYAVCFVVFAIHYWERREENRAANNKSQESQRNTEIPPLQRDI